MNDCTDKYDDIINLPHHVSQRHPRMSMGARAAQFASFAALSGYDDAVQRTTHAVEDPVENAAPFDPDDPFGADAEAGEWQD